MICFTACLVEGEVRLSNELSGRLEVCLNGRWGTVCIGEWDAEETGVVCQQLGRQLGVEIVGELSAPQSVKTSPPPCDCILRQYCCTNLSGS